MTTIHSGIIMMLIIFITIHSVAINTLCDIIMMLIFIHHCAEDLLDIDRSARVRKVMRKT